jgi:crotonobetainyl-CoA:carnitine CoA-transferase CaiB-like acyl-CoA transferase
VTVHAAAPAGERMLSGVRVLDFTQYVAGPTATRLMAELGADVIKVEQGPGGDPSRTLPYVRDGRSAYFVQQNRGKRSLCVDLQKPEAVDLLRRLAGAVDVVVENYGPGVLERRGLDYATLQALNPRLIMASVSAFGRTGPLADRVGFDLIAQAFSGLVDMTGDPGGPPSWASVALADGNGGVHAFAALGYALYHRERTGRGQHIDISLVDALYHLHEINVQLYANSGGAHVPSRCGSRHPLLGPYGVYRGPKGWIALLVLDRQWPALVRALERPELLDDPRFGSGAARGQHRDVLAALIEDWMQRFPDDDAVLARLEAHRVPCAPVLSVAATVDHPHFRARDMLREVPDPVLGTVTIPGFPLKFSAFPELPDLRAPLLGEHNAEVLEELLGLDPETTATLLERGVLHRGAT